MIYTLTLLLAQVQAENPPVPPILKLPKAPVGHDYVGAHLKTGYEVKIKREIILKAYTNTQGFISKDKTIAVLIEYNTANRDRILKTTLPLTVERVIGPSSVSSATRITMESPKKFTMTAKIVAGKNLTITLDPFRSPVIQGEAVRPATIEEFKKMFSVKPIQLKPIIIE